MSALSNSGQLASRGHSDAPRRGGRMLGMRSGGAICCGTAQFESIQALGSHVDCAVLMGSDGSMPMRRLQFAVVTASAPRGVVYIGPIPNQRCNDLRIVRLCRRRSPASRKTGGGIHLGSSDCSRSASLHQSCRSTVTGPESGA